MVRDAVQHGYESELNLFAPAMAYTLVVSLAPLTIAVRYLGGRLIAAGAFAGSPLAGAELDARRIVGDVLSFAGPLGSLVAVGVVLWGATALFTQFVWAIHRIWGDRPGGGLRQSLLTRAVALLLLVVMGVGLVVSSVIGNAALNAAHQVETRAGEFGEFAAGLVMLASRRGILDFVFSAAMLAVAFTVVPHCREKLRDVLPGVALTAAAYALGQQALGTYLSQSSRFGALGTFGQFVAFLVWAYYTALIVLWGAELSYQMAKRRRNGTEESPIHPDTSTGAVVQ